MPILYRTTTGERLPWPTGRERDVLQDVQDLKAQGYTEIEMLAETATGFVVPVPVEPHINEGKLATIKLALKRPDGKPAYMAEADWNALSAEAREALIVRRKTGAPASAAAPASPARK